MAEKRKPLLNLTTLVERESISIDGVLYELKNADEFGLYDYARLVSETGKIEGALTDPELPEEEAKRFRDALDALTVVAFVSIPPAVVASLTETNKLQILAAFSELQSSRQAAALEKAKAAEPQGESAVAPSIGAS
jgi:hypothetical protein